MSKPFVITSSATFSLTIEAESQEEALQEFAGMMVCVKRARAAKGLDKSIELVLDGGVRGSIEIGYIRVATEKTDG